MGHTPRSFLHSLAFDDITIGCGFACIVGGVAWRYDGALALIVFGVGLLLLGVVAMWRHA
jgi:ABC-type bacteriocin/lantibiotic exporter with double-glycine peptidase domain